MGKKQVTAIEFTSEFDIMASIKKYESVNGRGGNSDGMKIVLESPDLARIEDIAKAKGNVLQVTFKVSTQKSIAQNGDAGQLSLGEAVGGGEE